MASDAKSIIKAMKSKKQLDIGLLSDDDSPCIVHEFIPTGCLPLDRILGGGLPVGRMTEFYGEPSSGKSLVAAQAAATALAMDDMIVAYVDTETSVSIAQMRRIGVDVDELIYATPDTDEDVFELLDELLDQTDKANKRLLFIWDSVAATSSKAELEKIDEKGFGETGYLSHARVISQSLRVMMRRVAKSQAALLFLNQIRDKIGVMYGEKTSTFGGKAVPFHASVRVELKLHEKLKAASTKKKIVGVMAYAYCVKNKIAHPYQSALLPIYFGYGVNDAEACRLWLRENGYITGTAWQILSLSEQEIKFQLPSWPDVYEQYYSDIAELIMSGESDSYDAGYLSDE